uniref:Uncharacterized protein n=1 Tax=Electrophorus electricus TaxID=8005 RepID=A0A4W4ESN4_ELEEL
WRNMHTRWLQCAGASSEPSPQSGSPSHVHSFGTHSPPPPQWNSCGPHVMAMPAAHFSSSLPSPQSSSPSHTKVGATHKPLRHWNSLGGHALPLIRGFDQEHLQWPNVSEITFCPPNSRILKLPRWSQNL